MVKLVQYLTDTVGDGLRGVATYDDTDYEVLYVRDNLSDRLDDVAVGNLIDQFKAAEIDRQTTSDLFGGHGVTLRSYGNAFILHCVADETDNGTIISFDPDVGSQFLDFAATCAALSSRLSPEPPLSD